MKNSRSKTLVCFCFFSEFFNRFIITSKRRSGHDRQWCWLPCRLGREGRARSVACNRSAIREQRLLCARADGTAPQGARTARSPGHQPPTKWQRVVGSDRRLLETTATVQPAGSKACDPSVCTPVIIAIDPDISFWETDTEVAALTQLDTKVTYKVQSCFWSQPLDLAGFFISQTLKAPPPLLPPPPDCFIFLFFYNDNRQMVGT